jgi:Fe-S cluster biogenesis protein NfuA
MTSSSTSSGSGERVFVSLEFTPNPNTLKYAVNVPVLTTVPSANFTSLTDAATRSPLAEKLMRIEGIAGVMLGRDFVTVTKTDAGDWDQVHQGASKTIESHLSAGEPVLNAGALDTPHGSGGHSGLGASEAEQKIREVLDKEVRPAVAMDGGDITFERYEDGVVYLHLQGSCSGCPSSSATLKHGVEARLKTLIPEIREVVAV